MSDTKSKIKKFFRRVKENFFVDKFNCICCDRELHKPTRYGLCPDCLAKLNMLDDNICLKCGRYENTEADYCLVCQNKDRHFNKVRSCCVYEDIGKTLVHRIKFGGKRYPVPYLANMMIDKFLDEGYDSQVVVSVPISDERRKERGYNQSELIAKHIAQELRLDYVGECIRKVKHNTEQAKLKGNEREQNVIGVYKVVDKTAVKGKRVLVVDDVLTTGATMSEVCKMLYKAGASQVDGLTLCSTKYKLQTDSGEI